MTDSVLNFFLHFFSSILVTGVFALIYIWVTPYPELKLIREGAPAPALSLGGAMIGFSLPVASSIMHSGGLVDMLIWAGLSGLTQILVFFAIRLGLMRGLKLSGEQMSVAILSSSLSITGGILNAACLS